MHSDTGTVLIQDIYVNNNSLYIGTGSGIYYSNNDGDSWVSINTGLPKNTIDTTRYITVNSITSITSILFIGTSSNGVYKSTDNGNNWVIVNNGLTNLSVSKLLAYNNYLIAGTSGGLFISSNNGNTWSDVSNGLTNLEIGSIVINDSNIFVGINDYSNNSNNVWRRLLSDLGTTEIQEQTNIIFNLKIYPNPSNENFTIEFNNPYEKTVLIRIEDLTGKTIFETTSKLQKYEFNKNAFQAGVYIIKVIGDKPNFGKIIIQ